MDHLTNVITLPGFGFTFPSETFFWLLRRPSFAVFPVASGSGVWLHKLDRWQVLSPACGGHSYVYIGWAGTVNVSSFANLWNATLQFSSQGFVKTSSKWLFILIPLQLYWLCRSTPTDIRVTLCYTVWTMSVWQCFPVTPTFTVTIKDDGKVHIMDMVQIFPTASEMIISLQEQEASEMWAWGKAATKAMCF